MGTQLKDAIIKLNFEDDPPANIWQATSRALQTFGDRGATNEDLVLLFQKHKVKWKGQSISPALSGLVHVRCAKFITSYRVRRYYHLKTFTSVEHEEYKKYHNELIAKRKDKAVKSAVAAQIAAALPPQNSAPVLGRDANMAVSKGKMIFALGEKDTIVLEPKQARELYEQLKELFS